MSEHSFTSLALIPALQTSVQRLEYRSMTAIQAQCLPALLAGKDVIAQGHTGSGKTAAFGLALLNNLNVANFAFQTLVLCPTRELAEQVATEIRRLASSIPNVKVVTLYGGTPLRAQADSLAKGGHIIVGTPGRIEDHLQKGNLALDQLESLVLDEADRMLDMGFQKTLEAIVAAMPSKRQTMLFSATFPHEIKQIAEQITSEAVYAKVAPDQDSVRIEQKFYLVNDEESRFAALRLILLDNSGAQTVVFCNTRAESQTLAGKLKSAGFSATALHGDMEQKDRDQTMVRFSNASINILVATDVAARGLDIDALDHVCNYHLPRELAVYTHRIGRTGRAGKIGAAHSLYQVSEQFRVDQLAAYLDSKLEPSELPPMALLAQSPAKPVTSTLRIEGGKKQKLRPGDLVGALTKGEGISGDQIGKIQVLDNWTYVAIERAIARQALQKLSSGKIKGKSFRARLI